MIPLMLGLALGILIGLFAAHHDFIQMIFATKQLPDIVFTGQRSSSCALDTTMSSALVKALLVRTAQSINDAEFDDVVNRGNYRLWCEYRVAYFEVPKDKKSSER